MLRRYRAKAQGGLKPGEVDKRIDAVRNAAAVSWRELPPAMPHPGLSLRIVGSDDITAGGRIDAIHCDPSPVDPLGDGSFRGPDERPTHHELTIVSDTGEAVRPKPDPAIITITLSGPPGAGKSTLCHLILAALADAGVVAEPPQGLGSYRWGRVLDRILYRLKARLVIEDTAPEDCDHA